MLQVMVCEKCGNNLQEGAMICRNCGARVTLTARKPDAKITGKAEKGQKQEKPKKVKRQSVETVLVKEQDVDMEKPIQAEVHEPASDEVHEPDTAPDKQSEGTEVLGVGSFFAMQLLTCIPIVGFILLIIWSTSKKNLNRKHWATAMLIINIFVLAATAAVGMLSMQRILAFIS